MATARVRGLYRCEPVSAGVYRVLKDGAYVGWVERDRYKEWQCYRVDTSSGGNKSEPAGHPGSALLDTVVARL